VLRARDLARDGRVVVVGGGGGGGARGRSLRSRSGFDARDVAERVAERRHRRARTRGDGCDESLDQRIFAAPDEEAALAARGAEVLQV
jgi:hypothetical protein